tara:strand:- start:3024 stop:3533 length:510 start_codon:yes stop_codon:yes gene_type:complete
MNSILSVQKNIVDRLGLILFFFLPLFTSCSSKQNNVLEIITPPTFPKEFSSIPDQTKNPQLISLLSADEKIKDIRVGRNDPFLPIELEGQALFVPKTFKYHGQMISKDIINVFVSYEDRTGILKLGDIGGTSTDLLPNDWIVLNLDPNSKVLTLGFDDRSIDIELFIEK